MQFRIVRVKGIPGKNSACTENVSQMCEATLPKIRGRAEGANLGNLRNNWESGKTKAMACKHCIVTDQIYPVVVQVNSSSNADRYTAVEQLLNKWVVG